MAHYLITGGTGFIGSALVSALSSEGHSAVLLSRHPERHAGRFTDKVSLVKSFADIAPDTHFDGVVNLAGEGIAEQRWSAPRKQALLDSHAGVTRDLVAFLATLEQKPAVLVSGSAVGWYGAHGSEALNEESAPLPGFDHELCQAWEEAAKPAADLGLRLCLIRLGPVLAPHGGMLKRLLPPFRLGLGGRLGDGRQYLSWIHLRDVVRGIRFLLDNPRTQGVYNLCAPVPVDNRRFTRALAKALHRPALLPLPAALLRGLFGEMGEKLLLQGQQVVPLRLNRAGFIFDFETLDEALADLFPPRKRGAEL